MGSFTIFVHFFCPPRTPLPDPHPRSHSPWALGPTAPRERRTRGSRGVPRARLGRRRLPSKSSQNSCVGLWREHCFANCGGNAKLSGYIVLKHFFAATMLSEVNICSIVFFSPLWKGGCANIGLMHIAYACIPYAYPSSK